MGTSGGTGGADDRRRRTTPDISRLIGRAGGTEDDARHPVRQPGDVDGQVVLRIVEIFRSVLA